ncbi:hypothetical protein PG985_016226 [Apiospora marii]|uniref:Uncharacterized protein n=1 Tax=Apiospora marii TaxID=335849 RepID=A0ABR1STS5_9PEZI
MDALHWDTLGYAESHDGRTDDESASNNQLGGNYYLWAETEPPRKRQPQWQDVEWLKLVTLLAEFYMQERIGRRLHADHEGHRATKPLVEAPCPSCGSLPQSRHQIDTSRRHHRDTQEICCCSSSRELPRGPVDSTAHELPATTQLLDAERRDTAVAAPFVDKSLLAEPMEVISNQALTSSPTIEKTPIDARPPIKDEKEVMRREPPPASVPGFPGILWDS